MTATEPDKLIALLLGPDGPELTCDECFEQLDRFVQAAYVVEVPSPRTL